MAKKHKVKRDNPRRRYICDLFNSRFPSVMLVGLCCPIIIFLNFLSSFNPYRPGVCLRRFSIFAFSRPLISSGYRNIKLVEMATLTPSGPFPRIYGQKYITAQAYLFPLMNQKVWSMNKWIWYVICPICSYLHMTLTYDSYLHMTKVKIYRPVLSTLNDPFSAETSFNVDRSLNNPLR